jgi:hypothetical protein
MGHPHDFYEMRTQSGAHLERPGRTVLAEHIAALAAPDNTYLTVQPHADSDWYVMVTLPDPHVADPYDGIYELQFQDDGDHDDGDGERWSVHRDDPNEAAADVIKWVNAKLQQHRT